MMVPAPTTIPVITFAAIGCSSAVVLTVFTTPRTINTLKYIPTHIWWVIIPLNLLIIIICIALFLLLSTASTSKINQYM